MCCKSDYAYKLLQNRSSLKIRPGPDEMPAPIKSSMFGCAPTVTFLIAESCLLVGAVQNAYHTPYRTLYFEDEPSCQTLRKGVFALGAAFAFFTAILSEFYYISFSNAYDSNGTEYEHANMGMSLI